MVSGANRGEVLRKVTLNSFGWSIYNIHIYSYISQSISLLWLSPKHTFLKLFLAILLFKEIVGDERTRY